jgi:hypothetical protein
MDSSSPLLPLNFCASHQRSVWVSCVTPQPAPAAAGAAGAVAAAAAGAAVAAAADVVSGVGFLPRDQLVVALPREASLCSE